MYRETISVVTDSKVTACEGQNDTGDCRCYKYDHVGWRVSQEKCDTKTNHRQSQKNRLENSFLDVIVLRHYVFHDGLSFLDFCD